MQVRLAGPDHFSFVATVMRGIRGTRAVTKFYPDEAIVEVENPVVARLLRRLSEGRASVVSVAGGTAPGLTGWLITGGAPHDLDTVLTHASRFIIPTYASYGNGRPYPVLQAFNSGDDFGLFGTALFPHGYYRFEGPPRFENAILERLDLWLNLEEKKPIIADIHQSTYLELHETFMTALSTANWSEAERALAEMRRFNLIAADNLAFLRIQLLGQQQRWREIWKLDEYANLADLLVPRPVRAALISAFYYAELAIPEQRGEYAEALSHFKRHSPRLGRLLESRQGLRDLPLIHAFAYQAASVRDAHALRALDVDASPESASLFAGLHALLAASPPQIPAASAEVRCIQALLNHDYDSAFAAARDIEDVPKGVELRLQVAVSSEDAVMAEEAVASYRELDAVDQEELAGSRQVATYLAILESILSPIDGWLPWFRRLIADRQDNLLKDAFNRLKTTTDERYWTEPHLEELTGYLRSVAVDETADGGAYTHRLIEYFVSFFLRDSRFPEEGSTYGALYDVLRYALLFHLGKSETWSMALVRLSGAVLGQNPDELPQITSDLMEWFHEPRPVWEHVVIDAFELLASFGAQGSTLVLTYRSWVEAMLAQPSGDDRLSLEAWRTFGAWIRPGEDLDARIEDALMRAVREDEDNPVAALPSQYSITIFSLQESGAKGARDLLISRNPNLDVTICTAKHNTSQAESLARNSNMVVIVTACIKHALTFAIDGVVAGALVRPASCGQTSIVRDIEAYLRDHPS